MKAVVKHPLEGVGQQPRYCLTNTQAHQWKGQNRFFWHESVLTCSYFLSRSFPPQPQNSKTNHMEILWHLLILETRLPRSIGQSYSGAGGRAIRVGSNSLICKDPDLRHKLTGEVRERHLSHSQITFTVHRHKERTRFWDHATVIKFMLFLYSAHASTEDLSQ